MAELPGRAAIAAVAVALLVPATASASISCTYSDAGPPGPTGNVLSISATTPQVDVAAVSRAGDEIAVSDDVTVTQAQCSGGTPTVTNVDTIAFAGAAVNSLAIDERGGPFAPGATDEGDGSSEIEFDLQWEDGLLAVNSAPAGKGLALGTTDAGAGLNLNPTEPASDSDVALGDAQSVLGRGLEGAETLSAAGGAGFSGPLGVPVSFEGEGGADVLAGGSTSDLLDAGGGNDELEGGLGHDHLLGGGGRDEIDARDGARDNVRCGQGRDKVRADAKDKLSRCEKS